MNDPDPKRPRSDQPPHSPEASETDSDSGGELGSSGAVHPQQTLPLPETGPGPYEPTIASTGHSAAAGDPAATSVLRRFGDYEILEEIARGGMGVVYKARQVKLNRIIALKMILAGHLAGSEEVQRFYAEAEAAASLDHSGIVPIYEVGECEGQHFFSMGYIEGESLSKRIGGGLLSAAEAAELMRHIAAAIDYAHQHGVIHRDLKPGNILLDRDGHPRVSDFGLAKQTQHDSALTTTGQILGTPNYMPPEQAAGRQDIGPAADIYSLGAILYAMLTGRPPFQSDNVMDTLRQVMDQEPIPPRHLNASVPQDLETICLKCLQKEPRRRYATAGELAEELTRFLEERPIQARPVSAPERAWRWCRRNKLVAALLLLFATSLIGGTIGSSYFAYRSSQNALAAQNKEKEASAARDDATDKLWGSYLAQARAGRWSGQPGRRFDSLDAIRKAARIRSSLELRNEATACLALADLRVSHQWQTHPGDMKGIAFTGDLTAYARSDAKGAIRIRRVGDDQQLAHLPGPKGGGRAWVMHFSPDGRFLGAKHHRGNSSYPSRYFVWDVRSKKQIADVPLGILHHAAAFSNDGRRLAAGGTSQIHVYELPSGKKLAGFRPPISPHSLAWHPDAKRLAISSTNRKRVDLVDGHSGQTIISLPHETSVRGIAWHPHGELLATTGGDSNVYLWDLSAGPPEQPHAVLRGHESVVTYVAFNHAGNLLASSSWDGQLILWDPIRMEMSLRVRGLTFHGALQFSGDDRQLASRHVGNRNALWEVAAGLEHRRLPADKGNRIWDAQLSGDGRLLGVGRDDGLHLWDVPSLRKAAHLEIGIVRFIAFQDAGTAHQPGPPPSFTTWGTGGLLRWPLVVAGAKQDTANQAGDKPALATLRIGPPEDLGLEKSPLPEWGSVSTDGRVIAVGDRRQGMVVAFDLHKKKVLLKAKNPNASTIAISPDGRFVAAGTWGGHDNWVRVWDVPSGKEVKQWQTSKSTTLAFDPTGRQLVLGQENQYRFFEVGSWQPLGVLPKEGTARGMAFSRDGSTLALCPNGTSVRFVDPATRQEIATLDGAGGPYCFSRDGSLLITGGPNESVEVWDLRRIRRQLAEMNLDWN